MSDNIIFEGLNYARENFMIPIFVHGESGKTLKVKEEYVDYDILHIVPIKYYDLAQKQGFRRILPVYDMENVWNKKIFIDNVILNVKQDEIKGLNKMVDELIEFSNRININITELDRHFNEEEYEQQMEMISDKIIKYGK